LKEFAEAHFKDSNDFDTPSSIILQNNKMEIDLSNQNDSENNEKTEIKKALKITDEAQLSRNQYRQLASVFEMPREYKVAAMKTEVDNEMRKILNIEEISFDAGDGIKNTCNTPTHTKKVY
jgi:hypothetical protein